MSLILRYSMSLSLIGHMTPDKYNKDTKYGENDCQKTRHRTDEFYFLSIYGLQNVWKEVSLCPLKLLFISAELSFIILQHVCNCLLRFTINLASIPIQYHLLNDLPCILTFRHGITIHGYWKCIRVYSWLILENMSASTGQKEMCILYKVSLAPVKHVSTNLVSELEVHLWNYWKKPMAQHNNVMDT